MADSSKGRNKGSGFERKICRELSKWITGGKDEYCLKRNPGSGGSKSDKEGYASGGDITAIKTTAVRFIETYSVECKFYKDITRPFLTWIQNSTGIIQEFINQASEDSDRYKKKFILIFKSNNVPEFLMSDDSRFGKLKYATVFPKHNKRRLYLVPLSSLTEVEYEKFMV